MSHLSESIHLDISEFRNLPFATLFILFSLKISVNGDLTKFYLLEQLSNAIGIEQIFDLFRVRCRLANGQYFYRCAVKAMEE